MEKPNYVFEMFTPAEAEALTGVSVAKQRDWRRHGFIQKAEGHARFDAFDICELYSLQLLANRLGPKNSLEVSAWLAVGIFAKLVSDKASYAALDEQSLIEALKPFVIGAALAGTPDETVSEAALSYFFKTFGPSVARKRLKNHTTGGSVFPDGSFILWADNTEEWATSYDERVRHMEPDSPKLAGPIILVDQKAVALSLQRRALRPFITLIDETSDE